MQCLPVNGDNHLQRLQGQQQRLAQDQTVTDGLLPAFEHCSKQFATVVVQINAQSDALCRWLDAEVVVTIHGEKGGDVQGLVGLLAHGYRLCQLNNVIVRVDRANVRVPLPEGVAHFVDQRHQLLVLEAEVDGQGVEGVAKHPRIAKQTNVVWCLNIMLGEQAANLFRQGRI